MPFLISVSFSHSKSPHGWRLDLILRARRLECGFYGALTLKLLLVCWTGIYQRKRPSICRTFSTAPK
ncbi:hypothetical protein C1N51_04640 [Vibrio campbellii]|nr:hypothetical protein C1N51_04640 [Vibrio campbellii]